MKLFGLFKDKSCFRWNDGKGGRGSVVHWFEVWLLWYDAWVGVYVSEKAVYVCLLPMVVFIFHRRAK